MSMRDFIARVLAVFLIVGLVAAPLVSPAAAKPMSASQMTAAGMQTDMSCCPDEPQSNACPDCPLIALCIFKVTLDKPSLAAAVPLRVPAKTVHGVRNDEPSRDLDRPPPDQPPRISI
jgi:hypothetical protein